MASFRDRAVDAPNEGGARLLQVPERLIVRSLVPTTPFPRPGTFPWVHTLEDNWRTIRGELDEVLTYREHLPNFQDISTDQESITDDDRWKTFFLYGYGFKSEPNCARCPQTTRLSLEEVPGMTTAFFRSCRRTSTSPTTGALQGRAPLPPRSEDP